MTACPFVSVIMPVRNEAASIRASLEAVLAQDYPRDRLEILVADGLSDDGTREQIERVAARDGRVKLVDNPGRIVSTGLNAAISAAAGAVILRMDGHTLYAPDYVSECVKALRESGAENVGGPWRASGKGYVGTAIALAFQSPLASGGARSHAVQYTGFVDSVYLGCWRRDLFERIGGFDEELVRNQDDEHNLRLSRAGGRIWQTPAIRSWYVPRSSISALFRQYAQYGYWKVRVIQKHRIPASLRHLAPGAFVALVAALAVLVPFVPVARWAAAGLLLSYLLALLAGAIVTCRNAHAWRALPVLPPVFAAYHFGYGCGFLCGVFDFLVRRKRRSTAFTRLTREIQA
jgi:glycosyltransferase involved in cell wall biosynthesis